MPITITPILVTGASGFVAIHTIVQLLEQGYTVRGTIRSAAKESEVREAVARYGQDNAKLEIVLADLEKDSGWDEAMNGVEYVLHVASPFPLFEPEHEDDLIIPAMQGTLRVLKAAHNAKVKRVVQVSSNAAISAGHNGENRSFDENDWSIVENNIGAYSKSKTLAERAAWEFIHGNENSRKMEMVSINPPLILGPLPNKHNRTSAEAISTLMRGQVPGVARLKMGVVDVRDVASAILLAMITPEASNQRFAVPAETMWIKDIADTLHMAYGKKYRIPRILFPKIVVQLVALFDKKVKLVLNTVDWDFELSNEKAKRILKWSHRSGKESVIAMANSLVEHSVL